MGVMDRQIKAPSVLGHRQVNSVFVDMLPLQLGGFCLSETSEEKKLKKCSVDWVRQLQRKNS